MKNKDPNQVLAAALKFYMRTAKLNYTTLGTKAGIAANTVKAYCNPAVRAPGLTGKFGSAKLSEMGLLADALGVEVSDLVTDMSAAQRDALLRRRAGDYFAEHGVLPDWAPPAPLGNTGAAS